MNYISVKMLPLKKQKILGWLCSHPPAPPVPGMLVTLLAAQPNPPLACCWAPPKTPEIQPLFCKWGPGLPEVRQLAWGTSGVRTLVGLHGFLMTVCDPLRHGQSLAAYPARESSPVASGLTGDHEGWVIFLT